MSTFFPFAAALVLLFPGQVFGAEPATYLTRAEAAMMLTRSAGIPAPAPSDIPYSDVKAADWFAPYVMAAVGRGILQTDGTGYLKPSASVSRAEYLRMLAAAFNLQRDLPFSYFDIPRDAWYRPYIGIASQKKLFWNPADPLRFSPDARVTQDEATAAISIILGSAPVRVTQAPIVLRENLRKAGAYTALPAPPSTPTSFLSRLSPTAVRDALKSFFSGQSESLDGLRLLILQRVNAERRAAGMPLLRHNMQLALGAQKYAKDMYDRGYFSHFSPEGLSYVDRIRATGYFELSPDQCPCASGSGTANQRMTSPNSIVVEPTLACTCIPRFAVGENIAKGQTTTEQVMNEWMASINHRKNIISGAFEEIGIGIYGDVWVQNFGTIEAQ